MLTTPAWNRGPSAISVAFLHERQPGPSHKCLGGYVMRSISTSLHQCTDCISKQRENARGNNCYIHKPENNIKRLRNGPPPQSQSQSHTFWIGSTPSSMPNAFKPASQCDICIDIHSPGVILIILIVRRIVPPRI